MPPRIAPIPVCGPRRTYALPFAVAFASVLLAGCGGGGGPGTAHHAALPSKVAVKEFTVPGGGREGEGTGTGPLGITAGPDGNLWFTEQYRNSLVSLTRSGRFAEYAMGRDTNPQGIALGPDGRLWLTE